MKYVSITTSIFAAITSISSAKPTAQITENNGAIIENNYLKRTISFQNGIHTTEILNKLDNKKLTPTASNGFEIELQDGTILTAKDFTLAADKVNTKADEQTATASILLSHKKMTVKLTYTVEANAHFMRKQMTLTPHQDLNIKKVTLDSMELAEAYQPYTKSEITAKGRGKWRPGLGQPLYTNGSGTYWGIEYPASVNSVTSGKLSSSYLHGHTIKAGESYTSHSAVMGVADKPEFVKDAFFDYIDKTRIRPLRLQTQYNSWFDYGNGVTADKMIKSINLVSNELNTKRGTPPLKAYVIDDGWQQNSADWSQNAWPVNETRFDANFQRSFTAVKAAQSELGLWLSPGCLFGSQQALPKLKAAGQRTLDPWMSMSHPAYMNNLDRRMLELTKTGISYFKLDGIFGHYHTRNFDIKGFKGSEKKLNDPKYNSQKIQYLTDGTNNLINIFTKMHKVNPEVYIVISNGAWLSPWWLHHIDAIWMINAGDAAGGSDRTGELVYRDKVYHGLVVDDNTQFPLHSIFNHEPKKTSSNETKETFRDYLYMNMSRGTGFIELYIRPFLLKEYDWDVLAEGMLWAHDVFPTFKYAKMHGGSPVKNQVYGYTAWLKSRGYISIHNPSDTDQEYTITLNRSFGLHPDATQESYQLSSPIAKSINNLKAKYSYGDTLSLKLKPKEIYILNFDPVSRDWQQIKDLQNRTKADFIPPPKPTPVLDKNHPILGTWEYGRYTREFEADGSCTLKLRNLLVWKKPFKIKSATEAIVHGGLQHVIQPNGKLRIEGKKTATKKTD